MIKTVLHIQGMACSMCEAHINDAIRRKFSVRKVTSSHSKEQTVIFSEKALPEEQLRQTIDATGYTLLGVTAESCEKKGFSLFRK